MHTVKQLGKKKNSTLIFLFVVQEVVIGIRWDVSVEKDAVRWIIASFTARLIHDLINLSKQT